MFTISNSLSFIRGPLALLFLQENTTLRIIAILLAMITDSVDGYLARRNHSASRFGAILDPAMDKFFVYFVLGVFYCEGRVTPLEMSAMLSRDMFLILYGFVMLICGRVKSIEIRAIRWGKVTTALQFLVLIALCVQIAIPKVIDVLFFVIGILAFIELLRIGHPFRDRQPNIRK